jgi:hypothetical protein
MDFVVMLFPSFLHVSHAGDWLAAGEDRITRRID